MKPVMSDRCFKILAANKISYFRTRTPWVPWWTWRRICFSLSW